MSVEQRGRVSLGSIGLVLPVGRKAVVLSLRRFARRSMRALIR